MVDSLKGGRGQMSPMPSSFLIRPCWGPHVIFCNLIEYLLLLLSSLPAFPCGLRGQQLEIKPPHFTVFHHIHCFALVKFQAISSKILHVIGRLHLVLGYPTGLLLFALASKACLGGLSWGILLTWSNHLSWDLSIRRTNGLMLRDFRISELRTLLNSVTPSILRKNLNWTFSFVIAFFRSLPKIHDHK